MINKDASQDIQLSQTSCYNVMLLMRTSQSRIVKYLFPSQEALSARELYTITLDEDTKM